jgi:peptidoglycan/LPS O-acetylase OafA/YrhL
MTHWYYFLFTAGMVCADLHLILEPSINLDVDPDQPLKRSLPKRIFHGMAVFACLWLLSFPRFNEGASESLGYASLVPWIPPSWRGEVYQSMWWLVITAPVFIAVLDSAGSESAYQKFLTSGPIQYLGDISFALYLCHGMWINSLGIEMVWSICGRLGFQMVEGDVGFVCVLIVTSVLVMPLIFWHSEVFTRTVDKATLRLSARLTKL